MDKIYYFSGTGNSYHVAKKLSEKLGFELINIADVIEKQNSFSGEKLGIIFPVYAMGIPQMVGKFLTNLKIEGNPYIFSIATCGGAGYGIPFSLINTILREKKLQLQYSAYLKMPDNYLKLFKAKEKNEALKIVNTADLKLNLMIEEIKNRSKVHVKTSILEPIYKLIYTLWLENLKNADKKFVVKDSCISCKLCEEICPSKNIELNMGKPVWNGNCEDCMGCINLCPVKAIESGKRTENRGRYCNPYVNIQDMKRKERL